MKKLIITTTILFVMGLSGFAQGGGLFQRGSMPETRDGDLVNMPMIHGTNTDFNGNGEPNDVALGGGLTVLLSLGSAYLIGKKRREE
jgi:hypothetical protein